MNNSQQRFEDHKDNPMVQGLTRFIMDTLKKPLESVASWSIELPDEGLHPHSEKSQMQAMYGNIRRFHVRFTDIHGLRGWLRETTDGTWDVWQFQHTVTVSGCVPTVTTINHTSVAGG